MSYRQLRLLTLAAADQECPPELLCQLAPGDTLRALPGTIKADAARFERHFGCWPAIARCHLGALDGATEIDIGGGRAVQLRGDTRRLPYESWFLLEAL